LMEVKADKNSVIDMASFSSDSLAILLKDSARFIGRENEIVKSSYMTSGNASITIIDDPME